MQASKIVKIDGISTECNPTLSAIEDCESVVSEGTDPADLCSVRNQCDPDEALINAMGQNWITKVAFGDNDAVCNDETWISHGIPWCDTYNKAYYACIRGLISRNYTVRFLDQSGCSEVITCRPSDLDQEVEELVLSGDYPDDVTQYVCHCGTHKRTDT
jgi:hypothetical protein